MFLFTKTLRASMKLRRRNEVRKFDADAILFGEIQCKKRDILRFKLLLICLWHYDVAIKRFKRRYQCGFGWNQVKYATSCSNSVLGTRQMLMHEKTCVIPILIWSHYMDETKLTIHVYCLKVFSRCICSRVSLFSVIVYCSATYFLSNFKNNGLFQKTKVEFHD